MQSFRKSRTGQRVLAAGVVVLLVFLVVHRSPGQTYNLSFDPPFRLRSLYVFDKGETMSVGGNGNLVSYSKGERKSVRISPVDLNAIFFINNKTAIVVGNSGEILVSTDGGASWTKQLSGTEVDLQSVFCVDTENCWIAGKEKGIILYGGPSKTWKDKIVVDVDTGSVKDATDQRWRGEKVVSEGAFRDIYFVDRNIGFAVGEKGLVLKTEDSGKHWERISIPLRLQVSQFIEGIPNFESVVFKTASIGCVAGWDIGTGVVACTQDGGDHWTVNKIQAHPVGIVWETNGQIYVVDDHGKNVQSNDSGKTWFLPQK